MVTLYIKTHNITGLKYFGKTQKLKEDIISYSGSGVYWLRHLKKHGYNFSTEIYAQFESECQELIDVALKFSRENNIVKSKEWANLREENGLDGLPLGFKSSEETLKKLRNRPTNKGYKHTKETKQKLSEYKLKNPVIWTEDRKQKQSDLMSNRIITKETREKLSKINRGKIFSKEHKKNISESKIGVHKGMTYLEIYGTTDANCGFKKGEEHHMKLEENKKKHSDFMKKNNPAHILKECEICGRKIGLNNFKRHLHTCEKLRGSQANEGAFTSEYYGGKYEETELRNSVKKG